jgi:hypothetical protein
MTNIHFLQNFRFLPLIHLVKLRKEWGKILGAKFYSQGFAKGLGKGVSFVHNKVIVFA